MEKPGKVIAAFIGVFIAGAVFGGFFSLRSSVRRAQTLPPPGRLAQLPVNEQPKAQVAGPQLSLQGPQHTRSNPITPQLMQQFTKSLGLTPEQREKIHPIVGRAGEDYQRLREEDVRRRQEYLADVARVTERMYADVSNVLTPEQRAELQIMRQRIEDKFQAERQKAIADAQARAAAKNLERASNKQSAESSNKQPAENPK